MVDVDVIVVGAGINGLWTAYTSCKSGKKTVLLEQFPMPHSRGSSHGQTRIIRYGYSKPHHARMMPYAFKCWKELEKTTGCKLIKTVGMLNIFLDQDEVLQSLLQNYQNLNISHEVMTPEEVRRRFNGINIEDGAKYLYEPDGGILNAEKARLTLQNEIIRLGGRIVDGSPVNSIKHMSDSKVIVQTSSETFVGKSLILTCGPWANKILNKVGINLPLTPMRVRVYYWRERIEYDLYSPDRCPVVFKYCEDYLYSIPTFEYPGLMKVWIHTGVACDPDKRDENCETEKEKTLFGVLTKETAATFSNLQSVPSVQETCIYTHSQDVDNIIDKHPEHPNIIFATGFSGSGFKTAPTIGRILLDLAEGKQTDSDVDKMSMKRFSKTSKL